MGHSSTGLVIQVKDVSEADKVVFFLDQSNALKRALAKNAKKSLHRFVNCLQPFSMVVFYFYERSSARFLIKEASLVESFDLIKGHFKTLGFGSLIGETLMRMLPENDEHRDVFKVALETFRSLNKEDADCFLITSVFLMKVLNMTGYGPAFDYCAICKSDLSLKNDWVWQLDPPRCVCADHYLSGSLKWEWDRGILEFLRKIRVFGFEDVIHESSTFRSMQGLGGNKWESLFHNLVRYVETIVQKKLNSYLWLEKIRVIKKTL